MSGVFYAFLLYVEIRVTTITISVDIFNTPEFSHANPRYLYPHPIPDS